MFTHRQTILSRKQSILVTIFTLAFTASLALQISATNVSIRMLEPHKTLYLTDQDGMRGIIVSPGYPHEYPSDSESIAVIDAEDSRIVKIKIEFLDFDVERSNLCSSDALEFLELLNLDNHNGGNPNRLNAKAERHYFTLCGSELPRSFVWSIKHLKIRFRTDEFGESRRGFKLKYQFITDKTYYGCEKNEFRCRNRKCISAKLVCNKIDDCGDGTDEEKLTPCYDSPTINYPTDYKCGVMFDDKKLYRIQPRVVGGELASIRTWPSHLSFQLFRVESMSHMCGGTLIHPMFVISAAHCFSSSYTRYDYRIVFGSSNFSLETNRNLDALQVRYPRAIHLYPGVQVLQNLDRPDQKLFDSHNDIALVQLNAPIVMGPNVWPACLPHIDEPLVAGRKCVAAGWGNTRGSGGSGQLKQVNQYVERFRFCSRHKIDLSERNMICVKNQLGDGACNGDSGGPLYCDDEIETSQSDYDHHELQKDIDDSRYINSKRTVLVLNSVDSKQTENGRSRSIGYRPNQTHTRSEIRWTVHGTLNSVSGANMEGGYCALPNIPTLYARVSTKIDWILSLMELTRFDWDNSKLGATLGHMFRSGNPSYESPNLDGS